MPQFEPTAVDFSNLATDTWPSGFADYVEGYLQAAEFTADEQIGGKNVRGWTNDAKSRAAIKVQVFLTAAAPADVEAYLAHYPPSHGYGVEQCMGHDIWYTSNGHGVGFWDRDYAGMTRDESKALGERLTKAAKKVGDLNVWRMRNGWLDLE